MKQIETWKFFEAVVGTNLNISLTYSYNYSFICSMCVNNGERKLSRVEETLLRGVLERGNSQVSYRSQSVNMSFS